MRKLSVFVLNFYSNAQIQWMPSFQAEDIEENFKNNLATKPIVVENYGELPIEIVEVQQELAETGNFQNKAQCWKCSDATSYDDCAANGHIETCDSIDAQCFIEARIRSSSTRRFTTGCKLANACADLKNQNFRGPRNWNQCKPENHEKENDENGESVCRQCFRSGFFIQELSQEFRLRVLCQTENAENGPCL